MKWTHMCPNMCKSVQLIYFLIFSNILIDYMYAYIHISHSASIREKFIYLLYFYVFELIIFFFFRYFSLIMATSIAKILQ